MTKEEFCKVEEQKKERRKVFKINDQLSEEPDRSKFQHDLRHRDELVVNSRHYFMDENDFAFDDPCKYNEMGFHEVEESLRNILK